MRRLLTLLFLLSPAAFGYASVSGWCQQGGQKVIVQGIPSSTNVQQSYPNLSQSGAGPGVTVYATGTTNKLTLYSDAAGTPLNNPFPCASNGQFQFFTINTVVDILFSGIGITSFTISSITVTDGSGCPTNSTCDANYATLKLADTAAGTGSLYCTRGWPAQPTETLSSNIVVLGNCKIQPASAQTVKLSGSFTAPAGQQIFDYSLGGKVILNAAVDPVYPQWWGAKFDNSTDDWHAWQYALDERANYGGTVKCQGGTSLIAGGMLTYNYDASGPIWPNSHITPMITVQGSGTSGFSYAGQNFIDPPSGGCVLNMTYSASVAKFQAKSFGSFRWLDVTMYDSNTDYTPFAMVTNTTIASRIYFRGPVSAPTTCQTGWIVGGIGINNYGWGDQDGYQGYGSTFNDSFSNMCQAYRLQTYANNVIITAFFGFGNASSGGAAAILFDGSSCDGTTGLMIAACTNANTVSYSFMEQTRYTYMFEFRNAESNTLVSGSVDDGSGAAGGILLSGGVGRSMYNQWIGSGLGQNGSSAPIVDTGGGNLLNFRSEYNGKLQWGTLDANSCALYDAGFAHQLNLKTGDNSAGCDFTTAGLLPTFVGATGNISTTAGNISAIAGNITATAGNVTAGGTVVAGTSISATNNITATTGNITAMAGNLLAGGSIISNTFIGAAGNITSNSGNIQATAGNVVAGGQVLGGTQGQFGASVATGTVAVSGLDACNSSLAASVTRIEGVSNSNTNIPGAPITGTGSYNVLAACLAPNSGSNWWTVIGLGTYFPPATGATPACALGAGSGGTPGADCSTLTSGLVTGTPYSGFVQFQPTGSPTAGGVLFTLTVPAGAFRTGPVCQFTPSSVGTTPYPQTRAVNTGVATTIQAVSINAIGTGALYGWNYYCPVN